MNYGGHYHNTPDNLIEQARAEHLDAVYNLIVNKEERIPDIASVHDPAFAQRRRAADASTGVSQQLLGPSRPAGFG